MLLVTGPTGNVGADLSAALCAQDGPDRIAFRLAAHTPAMVRERYGADVPVVAIDYDDPATFAPALEGVQTLFLVFPLPSPRAVRTRMRPLISAAAAAGVRHAVYLSVPGADRSKVVPHHWVERALTEAGLHPTVLRPSYFMQNLVRAVSTHGVDIADRDQLYVPNGSGRVTLVDSRDVSDVVLAVAGDPQAHADRSYVLPGPQALDFTQVAQVLSDALGREIRYVDPSPVAFWRHMRARGVSRDTVAFMEAVYLLGRRGRNEQRSQDLVRLLGRPPRTLRTFAEDSRWRWEQHAWT